jgi:2,3-bisphosphoglycerate-independent phosphoglycerate mutase
MSRTFFLNISTILFLFFPISIYAVEGMSSEEISVREKYDEISRNLYECFAINNVDPRNIEASVCKNEQDEMKRSAEMFNKFMREKEAKAHSKISREKYKEFMKKYSAFTEDVLKDLHEENCKTKWGSSGSSECNAIAESLARKKIQRLQSK